MFAYYDPKVRAELEEFFAEALPLGNHADCAMNLMKTGYPFDWGREDFVEVLEDAKQYIVKSWDDYGLVAGIISVRAIAGALIIGVFETTKVRSVMVTHGFFEGTLVTLTIDGNQHTVNAKTAHANASMIKEVNEGDLLTALPDMVKAVLVELCSVTTTTKKGP